MKKVKKWWVESKTWQHVLLGMGLVFFLYLISVMVIRITSKDRILPGVSVRGVYVGGLNKQETLQKLNDKTSSYLDGTVTYFVDGEARNIKPTEIGVSFDNNVIVDEAFALGRSGNLLVDIATQTALPFASEDLIQVNLDQQKYSQAMVSLNNQLAQPSQNASYSLEGTDVIVSPEKNGRYIDMGLAVIGLASQFSNLQKQIDLPIIQTYPDLNQANLNRQKDYVSKISASPITLINSDKTWDVSQQQILSWLSKDSSYLPLKSDLLNHYYPINNTWSDLKINQGLLSAYLESLAGQINVEAVNAQLSIADGRATVFKQSRDGITLNVQNSVKAITEALTSGHNGAISLSVDVKKADVSDENIDNLGIKELISEGVTYFPGSPPNRLQNVRVGMSKFNGILLKPDQIFSFGEFLGEVGPAQGYAPGLIILGDHEEKAYGGGLCQVSSTAYRAALLAGLPILQRTNHAFAISYYTAPFGVPGVDATIYYPQVDMKFKNDTGHHILIQTEMVGTTLTFRFYGTKTKSGVIRGPFYVSGNSDATKPSQTVFYRDVLDLGGKVTKTDTVNTFYKSSLDFPIID